MDGNRGETERSVWARRLVVAILSHEVYRLKINPLISIENEKRTFCTLSGEVGQKAHKILILLNMLDINSI